MSYRKSRAFLVGFGMVLGLRLAGCSHSSSSSQATPAPEEDPITSIVITPGNAAAPAGFTQQFTATATHESGKKSDVTAVVFWDSSDPGVAVISTLGLLQALGVGKVGIRATIFGDGTTEGVAGLTTFKVNKAVLEAVEISPAVPSIANETAIGLSATGIYSDLSKADLTEQVTWSSSDPVVATVSDAAGTKGLAAGLSVGTSTVSAAMSNVTGSVALAVTDATLASLEVAPINPTISPLTPVDLVATGIFTDGTKQDLTTQASWSSSNGLIAGVSNAPGTKGHVTGAAAGSAAVSAALLGQTGSTIVTVTNATVILIQVTPHVASLASGGTLQFTAVAVFSDGQRQDVTTQVTWGSDERLATVSNESGTEGLVTGVAPGPTVTSIGAWLTIALVGSSGPLTVTAAKLDSIEVTPAAPSLAQGTKMQFKAIGTNSDGTKLDLTVPANWTSSNDAVAVISNLGATSGLATGLAAGSATISAMHKGTEGFIALPVTGSITLPITNATLTAIEVSPPTPSIRKGTELQFTATGTFSDGTSLDLTSQVIWQSSDPALAAVSNASGSEGLASAVAEGTAAISAAFGGVTGGTELTVTGVTLDSIVVTPANPSTFPGKTIQFTATGLYSDNTTEDLTTEVTWSSSPGSNVRVSNEVGSEGLGSAGNASTETISATKDGRTGSTLVTVIEVKLESIEVTPADPTIAMGTTLQFKATAIYTDGTTQNRTRNMTWVSSDNSIATVSNVAFSEGLAFGAGGGTVTVSGFYKDKVGSTLLTVTP